MHFVISKNALILKALSLKRANLNAEYVSLTAQELDQYIEAVQNDIQKLQADVGSFTYEISNDQYVQYSPIDSEIESIIAKVKFFVDKEGTYSSYNSYEELNYAQASFIPACLKACLTPVNYRQILNLPIQTNSTRRYKKSKSQKRLAKQKLMSSIESNNETNDESELGNE